MIITLTLQSSYTGNTNIGPFTVSGTTNGGGSNAINMTTGSIPTSQLISGWSYNDDTDTLTGGTIASSGTCSTSINWTLSGGGGGNTGSTPAYSFTVASGNPGQTGVSGTACDNWVNNESQYIFTMYSTANTAGFVDGSTYYDVYGNPFNGRLHYFSDGTNYGRINSLGVYAEVGTCGNV